MFTGALGGQGKSHPLWILGTECSPSARAESTSKC